MKRIAAAALVLGTLGGCAAVLGMDELPVGEPGADGGGDVTAGETGPSAEAGEGKPDADAAPPRDATGGDTGADADSAVADSGPDADGAPLDARPDGDAGPDSGPDADGAPPDAGPDGDAGPDADAGPRCGNGATEPPEQCDDNNTVTETCPYGQKSSCTVCDSSCKLVPGAIVFCGDGKVNGPEDCDDNNTDTEVCAYGQTSCTVCDATCKSVAGATAYCGDGKVNGSEQCDDGAKGSGNGCSGACTVEPGYVCSGSPSACNTVYGSCVGGGNGRDNCGSGESCCTSLLVPGGTFSRSYDGVTAGYTDPQYKATVSDFKLDKYEVTVGRFRKFVDAVLGGWLPAAGSGKHSYLNGGDGLNANGQYERGWDAAWNTHLPTGVGAKVVWGGPDHLWCDAETTWTPDPGANEQKPITCASWFKALAFCIWDGGFLPSEAEWNYAAAGGNEQRVYPWGGTAPGADTNLAIYNCYYKVNGSCSIAPVGSAQGGNGRWGHADLAGNAWEWTLDVYKTPYNVTQCANCANLFPDTDNRAVRGGTYRAPAAGFLSVLTSDRYGWPPSRALDYAAFGVRCARAP